MKYLKKFENFSDEEIMKNYDMEDVCEPCDDKEDDELYSAMGEEDKEEEVENITLEKKKIPAGLKAYLDKKKKKEGDDKDSKGKTPKTEKEKKFAALAPPKDKITYADKIAGAKKK